MNGNRASIQLDDRGVPAGAYRNSTKTIRERFPAVKTQALALGVSHVELVRPPKGPGR